MDLVAISVAGWRRLRNKQSLQTNGKIVSILGPNEAGKSSVLDAIAFLRSGADANQSDVSRGAQRTDLEIKGYFALTSDEVAQAGLPCPTRLVLTKGADGNATFLLEPPAPLRDLDDRRKMISQIEQCLDNPKFSGALSDEVAEFFDGLLADLISSEEDLTSETQAQVKEAISILASTNLSKMPKYARTLGDKLNALSESEKKLNPKGKSDKYLGAIIPEVLFFDEDERDLRQDYNIDELSEQIPVALENLLSVAELNILKLIKALGENDVAEVESLKALANNNLRIRFEETWSQSGVHVSLAIKDRVLNIVIENEPHRFTNLAERSEGFRQFVALQTFTMKKRSARPILLIDEAELHLHYDAQADLVQMLGRQEVAAKVIYTTHSAGCLPEDLGNGVRLVSRTDAANSRIINRFWGNNEIGFSSLLIGMGASTLAFFPIRKALMVEGEGEMLLLPTMLREILQKDILGFQIVPGLSKANKSLLPIAGSNKNHIAYLADGDEGGRALARELRKNNAAHESIFSLTTGEEGVDCQLEDFIDSDVLRSAVNSTIEKFSPGCDLIGKVDRSTTKKFSVLENLFQKSTKKKLMKVDVAYEILEMVANNPELKICASEHRPVFLKTTSKIVAFLEKEDTRVNN